MEIDIAAARAIWDESSFRVDALRTHQQLCYCAGCNDENPPCLEDRFNEFVAAIKQLTSD